MTTETAQGEGSQPSTPVDATVTEQASSTNAAESSTATPEKSGEPAPEAKTPEKLSDAVRDVFKESRKERDPKADNGQQPAQKAQGTDAKPDGKSETDEPTGEDKPPPFHTHPRWIKLNEQHKAAKSELATVSGKVKELEPLAEVGRNWHKFMETTGLSEKEVEYGQGIMALMKNDPEAALEVVGKLYSDLQIHVGKALPADVQARVDSGEISEAAAKELVKAKRDAEVATRSVKEEEAANTARNTARADTELKTAVDGWWTTQKGADPDLQKPEIAKLVNDKVRALVASRDQKAGPITPTEAVKICKDAYDEVRKTLKALVPKPTVTTKRTEPSIGSRGPSQGSGSPKAMVDVVRATLSQSRGG